MTEITRLIVKELNVSDLIILGQSLGGLVALLYIKKYDDVSAFINIEGNLTKENCLFSLKVSQKSYGEFKNITLPNLLQELKASRNIGFRKWADSLEKSSPQAFYDCCASLVEYSLYGNLLDLYTALNIPTLYIYGSENKQDLKLLDTLQGNGCEVTEIPNSNHFLLHDSPAEFNKVLINFLSKAF